MILDTKKFISGADIKALQDEQEKFQKESEILVNRGLILDPELVKRLTELKVLDSYKRYYLEDILKIIKPSLYNHHSAFVRMIYRDDECSIILDNNAGPSHTIRADSKHLVNAAGKFLIEAIERGFLKTNWQELLRIGLITSEYEVRSNLMVDRNWIKSILETYTKKPETFLQKIKKICKPRIYRIKIFYIINISKIQRFYIRRIVCNLIKLKIKIINNFT
jgi:hypothetical protein